MDMVTRVKAEVHEIGLGKTDLSMALMRRTDVIGQRSWRPKTPLKSVKRRSYRRAALAKVSALLLAAGIPAASAAQSLNQQGPVIIARMQISSPLAQQCKNSFLKTIKLPAPPSEPSITALEPCVVSVTNKSFDLLVIDIPTLDTVKSVFTYRITPWSSNASLPAYGTGPLPTTALNTILHPGSSTVMEYRFSLNAENMRPGNDYLITVRSNNLDSQGNSTDPATTSSTGGTMLNMNSVSISVPSNAFTRLKRPVKAG